MKSENDNSELRALLSIRRSGESFDKHYSQIVKIEEEFNELNRNAIAIIEGNSSPQTQIEWKIYLKEMNDSLCDVNELLKNAKERIAVKNQSDSFEIWNRFEQSLIKLKEANKKMEDLGFELLPESEHLHWKKDICNFENTILPLIISFAETCKLELQIIERYSPVELHKMTQIVLDHIPADFNFEEADKYEEDYLGAFENFKKEFLPEKNLWDRFLDILAGGTHQPPSERVMMKRWLEGEKHDL